MPVLVALIAVGFHVGISRAHHLTPFLCALAIFALCFRGIGHQRLSHDGAALRQHPRTLPPRGASQLFLLVGAVVLIPLILAYSGLSYWIFRGKVKAGAHYH